MALDASNQAAAFVIDSTCLRQSFFFAPSTSSASSSAVCRSLRHRTCLLPAARKKKTRATAAGERERELGEIEREG